MEPHKDQNIEVLRTYDEVSADNLRTLLFNDDPQKWYKWRELFADPIFSHKFDVPLDEMRDRAYAHIKKVCDSKLVSIFDFKDDPRNIFTAHEMLSQFDGNLATKFTV